MKTVRAVYENGVFRPTEPVALPEACTVEFEPRPIAEEKTMAGIMDAIYAVLAERYESGEPDVAARHK